MRGEMEIDLKLESIAKDHLPESQKLSENVNHSTNFDTLRTPSTVKVFNYARRR
jgi:hypothetical protein